MTQVNFLGKSWIITGVRTAEQVSKEFPDPRVGILMKRKSLELVLLREAESPTVDLLIARIYQKSSRTVAFRDQQGNILDPDSFTF
jgi:hypothetical protein